MRKTCCLLFPSLPTTEEDAPQPRSTYGGQNDGANDEKRLYEAVKCSSDRC